MKMNRDRFGRWVRGLSVMLVCASAGTGAIAEEPARPKIGLALGGGGALGFAHVGVLRALEELQVPIDYIAGTSMGSIIGGLYASGMSPDEIEAFLEGLDWNEVMSDETPRVELFFRRKIDDQRFLAEFGLGRKGIKIGSGVAAGQKFNNLLELVTLRSSGVTNFNELPIPYRAVATDLLSGEAYVLAGGRLSRAMRASMAVPGVFTPVELDGRVLVDGGVVNNLPVDVVKAMGADIVIAVDVGSASDVVDPETLRSLVGILGRTYSVAQRPDQVRNLRRADVGLQPDLKGFTASQFAKVSELIPRGAEAVRRRADAFAPYRVGAAEYQAFLGRQRKPPPGDLHIGAIEVEGQGRVSEEAIRGRIRTQQGDRFDPEQITADLQRIYGMDEFEHVLFKLRADDGDARALAYEVKEKPWGPLYARVGLRMYSDFTDDSDWVMLVNVTRMSINRLGAEWRNELQIGSRQAFNSEFYQPLDYGGLFFLAPNVDYRSELQEVYEDGRAIADYDVSRLLGRLDAGIQLRQYAELRAGPFWGLGSAEVNTGAADLPEIDEDLSGVRAALTVDRQDRSAFPRQGYSLYVEGQTVTPDMGGEADYDKVQMSLRAHRSIGDHTLTAALQAGSSLGSELPGYAQFTLGGPFGFCGLAQNQFRGNYQGILSLMYRYRLVELPRQFGRGIYAVVRGDVGNVWMEEADVDDLRQGALVGLGADTAIGPLLFGYGRSDEGFDRFYLTLGTLF